MMSLRKRCCVCRVFRVRVARYDGRWICSDTVACRAEIARLTP
jgi:hypothetical protein